MKTYLITLYAPPGPPPAEVDLTAIMAEVEKVNADIRAAGGWVFAGGLGELDAATTIRTPPDGSEQLLTDGPFLEAKEHLGGPTTVLVRLRPHPRPRRHRPRRGRGAGRLHRRRRTLAPGGAAAQPRRLDHHDGPQPSHRRPAPGGQASRAAYAVAPPPRTRRCLARPMERGPGARRSTASDLHLLPPSLAPEARVALSLRLLGGLATAEIARAFLVPEATMAQRIVRAKKKIRETGIPYRVPRDADLPDRLGAVLAVIYLVFTEGHVATSGDSLVRPDLTSEAIRLGRVLVELMPDEPEAVGLLALKLLTEARRPARTGPTGELRLLADQDRSLWDWELIAEGHNVVRKCLRRNDPGPYQIQAAIDALHLD